MAAAATPLPPSLARATTKTLPAGKTPSATGKDEKRVNKQSAQRRRTRTGHVAEAFHVERRKNARQYQEDRFDVYESPMEDVLIAAVYDGHGGAQTSEALMRGKRRDGGYVVPPFTRYLFEAYEQDGGQFPTGERAVQLFHDYDGSLWQESERRRMQQLTARKDVRSVLDETVLDADDERERLHAFSHVPYTSDEPVPPAAMAPEPSVDDLPRVPVTVLQPDRSGSTVALLARDGCRIYLYNVGDSRALVMDAHGRVVAKLATEDHKPERQAEAARAKAKGGEVTKDSGTARTGSAFSDYAYATSRAMGDVALKKDFSAVRDMGDEALDAAARDAGYLPNMRPLDARMAVAQALAPIDFDGVMSSTPDVYVGEFPRAGTYYALLATDGLWDVTENSDVAQWVRDTHEYAPESAYLAAKHLADTAIKHASERKTEDNTTVLAVRFDVDEEAMNACAKAYDAPEAPMVQVRREIVETDPSMQSERVVTTTVTAVDDDASNVAFWQDFLERILAADSTLLDESSAPESESASMARLLGEVPLAAEQDVVVDVLVDDTARLDEMIGQLEASLA